MPDFNVPLSGLRKHCSSQVGFCCGYFSYGGVKFGSGCEFPKPVILRSGSDFPDVGLGVDFRCDLVGNKGLF
nr:hypothetical protein [Brucella anthropi]